VPHLDELTPAEASAIGQARTVLARLLHAELEVELVQSFVSGRDVAHFHEHVFVRHVGTPTDVDWSQPWADAPSGDIPAFTSRLKNRFKADPAFAR
jgi:diadenosine tetraphosphate (Ap4A) HIT family hydrolase